MTAQQIAEYKAMQAASNAINPKYKWIAEIDYDGRTLECYGYLPAREMPEVMQIAMKGIPLDISDMLADGVMDSIQATVEREWLDNLNQEAYDRANGRIK